MYWDFKGEFGIIFGLGVDNILWRRYLSTRELTKVRDAEMCRCRETNSPVLA